MSLVLPPRLRAGDTVAIVNPSLALPGSEPLRMLQPSVAALEQRGLRVRLMPHVGAHWRPPDDADEGAILAGSDEQRADDLNQAFRDATVRMVLAARGGGGASRLLPRGWLDWASLAADPKILFGFSDFTHLALAAHAGLGLVTYDGPTALQWAATDDPMLDQAWAVLTRPEPYGVIALSDAWYATMLPPHAAGAPPTRPRSEPHRWLRPGRASGPLVAAMPGIYRRLLAASLAPPLAGAIWCLDPYRSSLDAVRHMLEDLRERGHLNGLAGIVVARPWPAGGADAASLGDLVLSVTNGLDPAPPVLLNADFGHTWPRLTLPNGVRASLDSDADRVTLLDAAVR